MFDVLQIISYGLGICLVVLWLITLFVKGDRKKKIVFYLDTLISPLGLLHSLFGKRKKKK